MSDKGRLCTHCGTFIAYDDAVRVCATGGWAHAGCEHTNYGDWHDHLPTEQDVADLAQMLSDEQADQESHL